MSMFEIGDRHWPGIAKLIEECGEVLQVAGKLIAMRGQVNHWDGTNLRDRLENELGDLLAAVNFVGKHCMLDQKKVVARMDEKLALFEKWRREQLKDDQPREAS